MTDKSNQAKRRRTKKSSAYDVARLAGVSQTTVSFVLNDTPDANIPQETRDRVWAAIRELNWRPNSIARALTSRLSNTIGLISDEIVTSAHAGASIQGAQDAAWAHGKMLLMINTSHNPEIERGAAEMMLERQVESVIYATMYHRPVRVPASLAHVPVVLLDCYAEDRSLPSVVPDEVQGGRTATEALLRKGHRRIGFINNPDPIPATSGRLQGYKQALEAYGVPFDPALVRALGHYAEDGYRSAMELMELPERPTALFCFNDVMAMGAYDGLRKLGLSIPDDVAVVGFDNLELVAAQLHPALTTVALPHYEMGQWAVQYLLEHAQEAEGLPEPEPAQQLIACSLVERSST
jgi:LacI family transcriptional regulator